MTRFLCRALFNAACVLGRPCGGIRPRRIYHFLGRRAFTEPEFRWHRNRWGAEFWLSPSYQLDRSIIAFGQYDADLHLLLERLVKPGMVCLDAGANLGEVTLHMAALVGPNGQVHAVEPAPPVFERLKCHIERNHAENVVRLHALALSNQSGRCTLAYAQTGHENQGLGSLVNLDPANVPLRAEVPTLRLDDLVSQEGLTRLDLIKVDIQGAEIPMLEGAREALARFSPELLMEVSPSDMKVLGKTSHDLCALLEACGYAIYQTKGGRIGERLVAAEVAPDFFAENIYCTKRESRRGFSPQS